MASTTTPVFPSSPSSSSPPGTNTGGEPGADDATQESVASPSVSVHLADCKAEQVPSVSCDTTQDKPLPLAGLDAKLSLPIILKPASKPARKRKRGDLPLKIITDLEDAKTKEALSPETLALTDRTIAMAQSCIEDPDKDIEGAELSFACIKRVIRAKHATPQGGERSLGFLLQVGDWAAAIINTARASERAVRIDHWKSVAKEMQKADPKLS